MGLPPILVLQRFGLNRSVHDSVGWTVELDSTSSILKYFSLPLFLIDSATANFWTEQLINTCEFSQEDGFPSKRDHPLNPAKLEKKHTFVSFSGLAGI
jgi:hypothetical protein